MSALGGAGRRWGWAAARDRRFTTVALVAAGLFLEVALLHFLYLDRAPSGFFSDEASIAYAARGIALDGHDEHGVAWPLYFESFGDYKNPLTIYLVALVVRVTGSDAIATVRAVTSSLALLTAVLLGVLAWQLWRSRTIALGLFCVAGVTPWLFTLGRTAFEVSALPAALALFLVLWLRADRSRRWTDGVWAGAALGLTAYSYTTMRLGTLLLVLALVASYAPWRRAAPVIAAGYAAALVYAPIAVYAQLEPGALTARFALISVFTTATAPLDLVAHIWRIYSSYFSPHYLFESATFRQGGQLLLATAPLIALGIYAALRRWREPFWRLVLLTVLIAPVPAALTYDFEHEIRGIEAAPFYLVLAALGAVEGALLLGDNARPVAAVLAIGLTLESASFLADYFTRYPERIAGWNAAGYGSAVEAARGLAAGTGASIRISPSINQGALLFAYYADEPLPDYRRSGAAALGAEEGSLTTAAPPGTILISLPNETVPGATVVERITVASHDMWGRPVGAPAFLVWRKNQLT